MHFEYFVLSHIFQDVKLNLNHYNKVNPRVLDLNVSLIKTYNTLGSCDKSIKYLKCEHLHKPLPLIQFRSTQKFDKLVSFMNGVKT